MLDIKDSRGTAPDNRRAALLCEPRLIDLCRARHKWIYADPGTMPRRVQRDGSALGRGGLLGGGRVAVLGIVTGFPGRPAAGLRDGSVLAVWTRGW